METGSSADQGYFHPRPPPESARAGPDPAQRVREIAAIQMIDVHIPTADGRELQLTRTTQPKPELTLLLNRLKLELPDQPPPKITAAQDACTADLRTSTFSKLSRLNRPTSAR